MLATLEDTGSQAEAPEPRSGDAMLPASDTDKTLRAASEGPLPRLVTDLAGLIKTAQKQGWLLISLHYTLAETTPAAEPPAKLVASFAPCQRWLHSQRIRQGLARKRAQGARLGRPVTMSDYAIKRIKSERQAGKSLTAIANGLNKDHIPTAQGGQTWHPATIRHTLNRTR